MKAIKANRQLKSAEPFSKRVKVDWRRNKGIYLLLIPILAFYIVFRYFPMYGATIAFQDFVPSLGISGSEWIGLENFVDFFTSRKFIVILRNTLVISFSSLIFCFPAPIILALLMNELRSKLYTRTVQTVTYLPHFISLVVICGLIKNFTANTGFISQIISLFTGAEPATMLNNPKAFVPIYIISEIWQATGWGSIIYLAALTGVDQQLYEAAMIDGAGRFRQTLSVTIPCIMPTIVTMLILKIGNILNVGYEKIILLYNPLIYDTSDVISTYVYREGLLNQNYGYSTAVGLFNSLINFILLLMANYLSKRYTETSLF